MLFKAVPLSKPPPLFTCSVLPQNPEVKATLKAESSDSLASTIVPSDIKI
jgi:hypothetical protein